MGKISKKDMVTRISNKLSHNFGVSPADASNDLFYKASVMVLRELLEEKKSEFNTLAEQQDKKQICYLCMMSS